MKIFRLLGAAYDSFLLFSYQPAQATYGGKQMLNIFNRKTVALGLAMAAAIAFMPVSNAALVNYSQNFEGMTQADTGALGADGWLVFGNVFSSGGDYEYGPFIAPNACAAGLDPAFSCVAAGEGGPAQGAQQLVAFSDYKNFDHAIGNIIESNLFQEQTIGTADVGKTMFFNFDAKKGDIAGSSTASAFIKTVDPNNGYALTNFITFDTTDIPTTWGTYGLDILIDSSLDGQLLQFGFLNTATNYEPSGVIYDNVNFGVVVPIPAAIWLFGSGLLGLVGISRRKKAA